MKNQLPKSAPENKEILKNYQQFKAMGPEGTWERD